MTQLLGVHLLSSFRFSLFSRSFRSHSKRYQASHLAGSGYCKPLKYSLLPLLRLNKFFELFLWWAVATLTTVGYGDVYPVTAGGKIFTTLILFIGLGIVAVPAGLISSALSEVWREEAELGANLLENVQT
nr:potassium channel family protein [Romeria gracilis]